MPPDPTRGDLVGDEVPTAAGEPSVGSDSDDLSARHARAAVATGREFDAPEVARSEAGRPRRRALVAFPAALWAASGYYLGLGVVTTLLALKAIGLIGHSWSIPLTYSGDALSTEASFKTVFETGWYEFNPRLGAPWGQHYHDFPQADNLHLMVARVFALFTDNWVATLNIYYLLTFPLAAIAGAWFVRLLGGSRAAAAIAGILYAFAPYHFIRNEAHLYLAAYYPVPLAAGLIYLVLAGRPLWGRRDGRAYNPLTWVTGRTVWTVLILALMGTASSYYSVFTLFFLTVAAVGALVARRQLRAVGGAVVAMAVLIVVMLLNLAPDLLYQHGQPANLIAVSRNVEGSEYYAIKLSQLLLPVPWERIHALANIRSEYDTSFPLPSEEPVLGIVASIGFLFLLIVVLLRPIDAVKSRISRHPEFWATQQRLAVLALFGFLVGMVGGISVLFAITVSDSVRSWNRIVVFLALFSLASVALILDRALIGLRRTRIGRRSNSGVVLAAAGGGLLLIALGLFDQIPPIAPAHTNQIEAEWASDQTYVDAIQRTVPSGSMIFQLPYMPFPESAPVLGMQDSDPFRPYLHSTDLRWSYGGMKGRPLADWPQAVAAAPAPRMVAELASAGFAGIHLDRAGYLPDVDAAVESELQRLLGVAPLISP
ncbi:MAG: hypothetical protein JO147_12075, partial [Actinobacteria bacterium]|nr:hypothetical protein [Actinomycetota bacterium]